MSNTHRTVFYVGVTKRIKKRTSEHKSGRGCFFTSKYNCQNLLYYEEHETLKDAYKREKLLKRWNRDWKIKLIRKQNPEMKDLKDQWRKSQEGES